jgi:CheY-like chemotaxis protein
MELSFYSGELNRSSPALLIVEDEPIARTALAILLNSRGYAAAAVSSAEAALEMVRRSGTPPIAVVDVDLPGMNGLDLVDALERKRPGLITVLVTAGDGERVDAFCRSHQRVMFLRKPLDFPSLLRLLDENLPGN